MRMSGSTVELSASDLSGFLSCIHLTALDLAVARGARKPPTWTDPVLIVLRERGLEHERGYVEKLRAQGLSVIDLGGIVADDAVARSMAAIRTGADVILQPALPHPTGFSINRRYSRETGNLTMNDTLDLKAGDLRCAFAVFSTIGHLNSQLSAFAPDQGVGARFRIGFALKH